jgi:hypothetical protein
MVSDVTHNKIGFATLCTDGGDHFDKLGLVGSDDYNCSITSYS